MKIAILGSRGYPYVYSGYETFVAELAPRLVQRGHSVTVYCHRGLYTERPKEVNGVRLVYLPAIEHKILSQLSHSLLATVDAAFRDYEVVLFVNAANGPFGAILRAAGKRSAINVDGLEWLRPKWRGLGARYFRWAARQATRLFDTVITDAHAMADVYRNEFGAHSTMIAYGAELAYSTQPERITQLGLAPREYYLVVGRLIPDNNADLIVRGFEQSKTDRQLIVVGGVPYKDSFAEEIQKTADPRIRFLGYVRDQETLKELYCHAYAYVHGHEFGGTNPSLLRALAAGCAVLALDTPFNREMLGGESLGIYFSKSPISVRDAVNAVDQDHQRLGELRASARPWIAAHYDWERIVDDYERALGDLLLAQ